MIKSYASFWTNIFNFSGTATRANYWWPVIINWLISGIIVGVIQVMLGHPLDDIYTFTDLNFSFASQLVILLAGIAMLSVTVRRLHDSNHSGFWIFIQLIPAIGSIWLFILMILPTKRNRWNNRI